MLLLVRLSHLPYDGSDLNEAILQTALAFLWGLLFYYF